MPSPPSLSVVVFTDGPARMVAAALQRVRRVASEIVVAVDDRVPAGELGPLQDVADTLVRAEFAYPLEANLAWLHQQATGDWILRLDSDDVVSDQLLRTLATPGWDDGITHAHVQYRWLWPEPDRVLDQAPWWPDPALRLIRNLPGIVRFPAGAHQPPEVAGARRFLDAPIYHLDLLLQDEAGRAAKAIAYERQRPGVRTDRGWSVSSTYYLPERLATPPATAPLPGVDAAAVAAVLAARSDVRPPDRPRDPAALSRVVRLVDRAPAPPSPDDAEVRILAREPLVHVTGRPTVVTVGVVNRTDRPWSPADLPANAVGGRFLDAVGEQVGFEVRAPLPGPVAAGSEGLVRLELPPRLPEGSHRLQVGVVQDGVAWHDAFAAVRLDIQRGRRVLVSTGVSTFGHLGDDLITREVLAALAEHLPDVVPVLLAHPSDGLAERFGCEVAAGPASLPRPTTRGLEGGRRSRDLVAQARLMAKGEPPTDPGVARVLEPFASASALVLAPGGGLASRYADEALMVCAAQALIARAFGLPVLIEAPSIGPIEVRRDHAALAELLNDAARVSVRDESSALAARRIGRAVAPTVVPDPATAAVEHLGRAQRDAQAWLADRNVPADRAYAVVSLRGGSADGRHLATVRAAVEALPEHTALIYLPHCWGGSAGEGDDLTVLQADEWAGAHLVPWDPELGDRAAVALVAGASLALGTRFHLTVLAAAGGVPAVALVGDEYDRLRIRAMKAHPGVRVVERDAPAAAAQAVADLLAAGPFEPAARWDGGVFASALAAVLPSAPTLR